MLKRITSKFKTKTDDSTDKPEKNTDAAEFTIHSALQPDKLVHTGRLYRHKENRWKEAWVAITDDATILWFNDKQCSNMKGHCNLYDVLEDLEVAEGALSRYSGYTPAPPFDLQPMFIAIPMAKVRGNSKPKLKWFCPKSVHELSTWLEAFAKVMEREKEFRFLKAKVTIGSYGRTNSNSNEDHHALGGAIRRRPSMRFGWGYAWDELRNSALQSLNARRKGTSTVSTDFIVPIPNGMVNRQSSITNTGPSTTSGSMKLDSLDDPFDSISDPTGSLASTGNNSANITHRVVKKLETIDITAGDDIQITTTTASTQENQDSVTSSERAGILNSLKRIRE